MKKIFSLLFAILMLCSCAAEKPVEQPGIDIPEELYSGEVPDVFLDFGFGTCDGPITKGGYEWNVDNGDGTMTNTIACGMHPLQFENIYKFHVTEGNSIDLVFEETPLSYELVRYEVEENRDYEFTGNEKSEPVETENNTFVFKRDDKNYVYVLNVKYPEGNCEYAFELFLAKPVIDLYTIVDGAESGKLVLAGNEGYEVMTLNVDKIPVFLDGEPADASVLMDGMTIHIKHSGMILETYPGMFASVEEVQAFSIGTKNQPGGSFFDLAGLYIKVLDDLWEKDKGLNSGAEYVSIDLSEAPGGLSENEKAAICWIFGNKHDVMVMDFTMEELKNEGYLTAAGGSDNLYQWDNGLLFTITDDFGEDFETYSLPVIKFNAMKWRSPLGAYMFTGCSASWPQMGTWEDYNIGAEAIS